MMKRFLFRIVMVLGGIGLTFSAFTAKAQDASNCTMNTAKYATIVFPSTIFANTTASVGNPVVVGGWRQVTIDGVAKCATSGILYNVIQGTNPTSWTRVQVPGHDGVSRIYYAVPISTDYTSTSAPTLALIAEIVGSNVTASFGTGGPQSGVPGDGSTFQLTTQSNGDVNIQAYYEFLLLKNTGTPVQPSVPIGGAGFVNAVDGGNTYNWSLHDDTGGSIFDRDNNLFFSPGHANYVFAIPTCPLTDSSVQLGNWNASDITQLTAGAPPNHPWMPVPFHFTGTTCNVNGFSMVFSSGSPTADQGFPVKMLNSNTVSTDLEVMLQQVRSNSAVLATPVNIINGSASAVYFSCDAINNACAPDSDLAPGVTALQANLFKTTTAQPVETGQGSATITVTATYM